MRFAGLAMALMILAAATDARAGWFSRKDKNSDDAEPVAVVGEIYQPNHEAAEAPKGQEAADFAKYWNPVVESPADFQSMGDFQGLYELNARAAIIWDRMLACNHGNFVSLRQNYLSGVFCVDSTQSADLRRAYESLHDDTRGWLVTADFRSQRDPSFGDLGLQNPVKKHSIAVYREQEGYNPYIKYSVLWIQAVLEVVANSALYSELDEKEFKRLLVVYEKSREEQYHQYATSLRTNVWASFSDTKNQLSVQTYPSNRTLHTALKLFGYLSARDCGDRGLFPEVAQIITEGWQPLADVLFDAEFGKHIRSDQTTNSVWMQLACGVPSFLKGVSVKSSRNQKRAVRREFHSIIRMYRKLDQQYSAGMSQ